MTHQFQPHAIAADIEPYLLDVHRLTGTITACPACHGEAHWSGKVCSNQEGAPARYVIVECDACHGSGIAPGALIEQRIRETIQGLCDFGDDVAAELAKVSEAIEAGTFRVPEGAFVDLAYDEQFELAGESQSPE